MQTGDSLNEKLTFAQNHFWRNKEGRAAEGKRLVGDKLGCGVKRVSTGEQISRIRIVTTPLSQQATHQTPNPQ